MGKKTGWSTQEKKGYTFLQIRRIFVYIVLAVSTVITIFPLVAMAINATQDGAALATRFSMIPGGATARNFMNAMQDEYNPLVSAITNSMIVASLTCLFSVYFSALTAYGIFAYDFRLKKYAFGFIMLIMMVPTQVSALGFFRQMRDFGLLDSFIPLIAPAIAAPATFFFIKQYMESALPMEIVEAGRIDGGHEFYIFNGLVMPILKPAMAVQIIFTFVNSWNNYFMPALLITSSNKKTLPLIIASFYSQANNNFDLGKIYMALTIAILPVVIVYLFLSKFIIRGIALGSVKG